MIQMKKEDEQVRRKPSDPPAHNTVYSVNGNYCNFCYYHRSSTSIFQHAFTDTFPENIGAIAFLHKTGMAITKSILRCC